MSQTPRPPTVRTLAAELGVAPITVSRALRKTGRVREELARRVIAHARLRGYRRDPIVAEVMSGLGRSPGRRYRETVAFVWTHRLGMAEEEAAGVREAASALGYRVEAIRPWRQSLTERDVSRILWSRGIRGVLLAPNSSEANPRYDLDWSRFAAVLVGSSLVNEGLTRVARDYYQDTVLALDRLRATGFRRVGLALDLGMHHRTGRRYQAAFLAHAGPDAPPPHLVDPALAPAARRSRFERWLADSAPEVVLGDSGLVTEWIAGRLPHARLLLRPREPGPGVRPDFRRIGADAMRALDGLLRENRLGLLEAPASILVPGRWVNG
jgi:DNA-binding LacI/PurR family transcriptional regulator